MTAQPSVGENAPAMDVVDVILRDGSTLRLRPPVRNDADAILDFFRALSEQSLYLRFHGFPSLGPQARRAAPRPGLGRARRAARHARRGRHGARGRRRELRAPARSERRRGRLRRGRCVPASRRRDAARRAARRAGGPARASSASSRRCCRTTGDMLGVFEALGFELTRELAGGEIEITFPIARTERYRGARRRARPRRGDRLAAAVLRAAQRRRDRRVASPRHDRRRAVPEHPRGRLRRSCLSGEPRRHARLRVCAGTASIDEIPDPSTWPSSASRRPGSLEAAEQALRDGVRALVVISAGFAETGSEGVERQEQLLALVRAHGARLIGPNCLGISVAGPSLNATFASRVDPPGNIGFSSQSGALGLALLEAAVTRGLGLSGVRLDRQQGRRLVERPARVVGGRRGDRGDPPLRRVVRQPAPLRPDRAPRRAPQADPRAEERHVDERPAGRELAHRRARRIGGRRRRALPPGGRHPCRDRSRS